MTRKDHIAIAANLKTARESHAAAVCPDKARDLLDGLVFGFCAILEQDNSRFDRARFLQACGVQS
jgi:hypothetical protein